MALKVNITLTSAENYNLLIAAVKEYRTLTLQEAQAEDVTPVENAELVHRARQLYNLLEEISK